MSHHDLKTWPVYYDAVARGEKTFEVRKDDRGFQKGDTVRLRRFEPGVVTSGHYTGEELTRTITWVLTGGQHGVEPGFVVLALSEGAP